MTNLAIPSHHRGSATTKGGGIFYTKASILCVRCAQTKDPKGGTKRSGMFFCAACSQPKKAAP